VLVAVVVGWKARVVLEKWIGKPTNQPTNPKDGGSRERKHEQPPPALLTASWQQQRCIEPPCDGTRVVPPPRGHRTDE